MARRSGLPAATRQRGSVGCSRFSAGRRSRSGIARWRSSRPSAPAQSASPGSGGRGSRPHDRSLRPASNGLRVGRCSVKDREPRTARPQTVPDDLTDRAAGADFRQDRADLLGLQGFVNAASAEESREGFFRYLGNAGIRSVDPYTVVASPIWILFRLSRSSIRFSTRCPMRRRSRRRPRNWPHRSVRSAVNGLSTA